VDSIIQLIKENFGAFMTAVASVIGATLALLGVIWQNRKRTDTTTIKQTSKGNNATMIGIQNNNYQSTGENEQCAKK